MKNRKIIYGGCGVGIIVCVIFYVVIFELFYHRHATIAFLDVGQGDAIMIAWGSRQILIDGGSDKNVLLEEVGRIMPFWDRTIEIVIATHPDADHIDGLIGIIEHYNVLQFWHSSTSKDSSIEERLLSLVRADQDIVEVLPIAGEKIFLNDFLYVEIVYPYVRNGDDNNGDVNDTSIALVVHAGIHTFYLGGDLSTAIEDRLPLKGPITVMKAGHHGSRESTSRTFLSAMQPQDVVISVGAQNGYGHPHQETLERITESGAMLLRTDHSGRIEYRCSHEICRVLLEK